MNIFTDVFRFSRVPNEENPVRCCSHNRFYFGCGCGGEVPLKIKRTTIPRLQLDGHILAFNTVNQSLFLVTEFGVRKIVHKYWLFGCLLLNDTHGRG